MNKRSSPVIVLGITINRDNRDGTRCYVDGVERAGEKGFCLSIMHGHNIFSYFLCYSSCVS